jgi:hypothetical protein
MTRNGRHWMSYVRRERAAEGRGLDLIQTWVYPVGVLQVSDRRLTEPISGKVRTDAANKTVESPSPLRH